MKTKKSKCDRCKKEIIGNPKFILEELTSIGYIGKEFCGKECLKEHVSQVSFLARLVGK